MSQGIHVYGSASMGALRAAELAHSGWRASARSSRPTATGQLEDDDEVAVAHGPGRERLSGLSEAMVNIRRTLAEAEASAVIGPTTARPAGAHRQATLLPGACISLDPAASRRAGRY